MYRNLFVIFYDGIYFLRKIYFFFVFTFKIVELSEILRLVYFSLYPTYSSYAAFLFLKYANIVDNIFENLAIF